MIRKWWPRRTTGKTEMVDFREVDFSKLKHLEDIIFQETCLRDKGSKGRQRFLKYMSSKDIHNFSFSLKDKKHSKIAAF